VDTPVLREHGIEASVGSAFGTETLPPGLRVISGHKPPGPARQPGQA
jgi:hypothetical protein